MKCLVGMKPQELQLLEYSIKSPAKVSAALNVSHSPAQRSQLLTNSSADLCRSSSCSKIWQLYKSNIGAFQMHLRNWWCSQKHLTILLHSPRALCLTVRGPRCKWPHVHALVRSSVLSRRFPYSLQTDLHVVDDMLHCSWYS